MSDTKTSGETLFSFVLYGALFGILFLELLRLALTFAHQLSLARNHTLQYTHKRLFSGIQAICCCITLLELFLVLLVFAVAGSFQLVPALLAVCGSVVTLLIALVHEMRDAESVSSVVIRWLIVRCSAKSPKISDMSPTGGSPAVQMEPIKTMDAVATPGSSSSNINNINNNNNSDDRSSEDENRGSEGQYYSAGSQQTIGERVKEFSGEYLHSISRGISKHRLRFMVLFLLALLIGIVFPAMFFGGCLCSFPIVFSTVASRLIMTSDEICKRGEICSVYLLLPEETATEMVIKFHTRTIPIRSFIQYTTNPAMAAAGIYSHNVTCSILSLEDVLHFTESRFVHTCQLKNLQPETTHYFWPIAIAADDSLTGGTFPFTVSDSENRLAYNFSTMHQSATEPVRFVIGGDLALTDSAKALARHAASFNPMFGVVAGDIVYTNGYVGCYRRYDEFFQYWREHFGFLPMMLSIGNHEVGTPFDMQPKDGPLYYYYFTYPQIVNGSDVDDSFATLYERPVYHIHKLGRHSSIVSLDSGCVTPYEVQAKWLETQYASADYAPFRNRIVAYHAPLFPSYAPDFDLREASLGRKFWQPVFDKYHVNVALEHHVHGYKRSKVIHGDTVVARDEDGTLYLGDGNWGIQTLPWNATDEGHDPSQWFIEKMNFHNHVMLIESTPEAVVMSAIDDQGLVFDYVRKMANLN